MLALGCMVIFGLIHVAREDRADDENGYPSGPQKVNERMMLERAYPDAVFDLVAYKNGVGEALRARNSHMVRDLLTWTVEGPGNIGGRFNTIAIHPTDPDIMLAGAATGGVFRTTDGGSTWSPVFDDQPYLSIGYITFDPSNPSTVWVGTGDANISGFCYVGDGIYKSTDGGTTWQHKGLVDQHIVASIIVDPSNSNIVYAATMGQPFMRDDNRGLYKTIDGGDSWTSVLFVSDQAGVIDMVMDPSDPQVLYVATFDRIRSNSESVAYGPNGKIWKTTNGGSDWLHLTNGLPNYPVSRIGLAIALSEPNTLYAIVTDSTYGVEGIYKTLDAGMAWTSLDVSEVDDLHSTFGWYFGKIHVNPLDPERVYILGVDSYTSVDGGTTWNMFTPPWYTYEVHADKHDMQFTSGNAILLCTDGGIYRTYDEGGTWEDIENIPVNQVYHAAENPHSPEEYWCGVQDNGTSRGNASTINSWERMAGGDGFLPKFDPVDPLLSYVEIQYGYVLYSDNGGSDYFDCTTGIDENDRVNWDMPYTIDPFDRSILYCGTERMYKMEGAPYGVWEPISNDLSDGGSGRVHTITTLSPSAVSANNIYAGTGDANVWASTNGGTSWNNVTGTLPERYVTAVVASPNLPNTVYVTHSGYREGENIPHVHRSDNNGTGWVNISGDLPQVAVNDILVRNGNEDLIFASTDVGVYYTVNGGLQWNRLGDNMPLMPVFDIEFNTSGTKVIASTFARSVQTCDISSLLTVATNDMDPLTTAIVVYPNPVSDLLNIEMSKKALVQVEVHDINGALVWNGVPGEVSSFTIPVKDLAVGTYSVAIRSGNERSNHRFVKLDR